MAKKLKYRLLSHDGSANYLEETKEKNKFKLISQFDSTRIGFDDEKIIIFADPSGGPMIYVGHKAPVFDPELREKTVKEIISNKKGIIITIE